MMRTQKNSMKEMKTGWPVLRSSARLLVGMSLLTMLSFPASAQQNSKLENSELVQRLTQRSGKYLRLTTDLPVSNQAESEKLDRWISSFDAAAALWAKFWNLPSGALNDWTVDGYVMQDIDTFKRLELIDPRVPEFPFAYALDDQIWVRVQPGDYYTQHLLLHEGVHSLVYHCFGDTGPTWFREGIAELLATHRGSGPELQIRQVPRSREASPFWGRFKRMDQLRGRSIDGSPSKSQVPRIETVLQYDANLRGDVDVYGWSWALASMLDAYPKYRETLLQAAQHGHDTDQQFNRWLMQRLAADWPVIQARWRMLVQDFDYGFDWDRERLEISKADPMWNGAPIERTVAADRGWQTIGVRLNRGMVLDITAGGTVIIDDEPKPWISHPDGVTVQYHQGRPLGKLIARMVPNIAPDTGTLPPIKTIDVGKKATIQVDQPCWLLLRVNDAPGALDDNQSEYNITVVRSKKPKS
ncbi:hypothetical protein [Rubripirellula obstinata]|nr:hypothetical protein [Rubripirellula obstinata]